jgi:WD40 repeat protein
MKNIRSLLFVMAVLCGHEMVGMNALRSKQQLETTSEQEQETAEQAIGKDEVLFKLSDKSTITLQKEEAKLFGVVAEILEALESPEGFLKQAIPLKNVSKDTLNRIRKDLNWVKKVKSIAPEQLAKEVKKIPAHTFTKNLLVESIENLKAAQYLDVPELIQRYAHDVALLLTSSGSLALLQKNDADLNALIDNIDPALKPFLRAYMPGVRWQERIAFNPSGKQDYALFAVAFSPNNQEIAVAVSRNYGAAIYNAHNGAYIRELFLTHDDKKLPSSVEFSRDGNLVLGHQKGVYISNAQTGMIVDWFLTTVDLSPSSVEFSADAQKILVACGTPPAGDYAGLIEIWQKSAQAPFKYQYQKSLGLNSQSFPAGTSISGRIFHIYSVKFSPDETMVLEGSDKDARIWSVEGNNLLDTLRGHTDRVFSVGYSPDGKMAVTSSRDMTAIIWDVSGVKNGIAGRAIHTLKGHTGFVSSACFSPDGTEVLTASQDKTIKLWDATTGELLHTFTYDKGLPSAVFSSDGQAIAAGFYDGIVKIWDFVSEDFDTTLLKSVLANTRGKQKFIIPKTGWARDAYDALSDKERTDMAGNVQI